MYVIVNEESKEISPVQMAMAVDMGTAIAKLLEEHSIHPDDLWIMEFPKGH